jgi:hypothetical protein
MSHHLDINGNAAYIRNEFPDFIASARQFSRWTSFFGPFWGGMTRNDVDRIADLPRTLIRSTPPPTPRPQPPYAKMEQIGIDNIFDE